jgi:arabinogalactan oligomer/maltooligosaccharide transport system permease protein
MKRSLFARIAVHVALIAALIVTLYPVLWVIKLALSNNQGLTLSASPWPHEVHFRNFVDVVTSRTSDGRPLFLRQLFNSVFVASAVTVVGIVFSVSAAYALSRFRFYGRAFTLRSFLVSQMLPGVVSSIPLYVLLDKLHLLDRLAGLVLVYATTAVPFCVFMLKGFFDSLPRELEEAVLLDGGTRFQAFYYVALPLARPAIAVTALFSFLSAWNEFIMAATLMNDPTSFTLPVQLQRYVSDFSTDWGRFAAGAIIVSLPVMALFLSLERHLIGGLTQGGVKG